MTTNTELAAAKRCLEERCPAGTRVLCAVSGGMDSMCLLHLLSTWGRETGIAVTAAHYNHLHRGEESYRDETFVRERCEEMGIPFVCGRGDMIGHAEKTGQTLEEAGRELRYGFLAEQMRLTESNFILTAHHADDNAETVLLNLLRGAGARGLSGIPAERDGILRPFLCHTREELAAYAASLGEVKNVINSAGLSPAMSDPETILRVNALGTVYVNQEFSKLMHPGSVICDISSNSAYALPSFILPKKAYPLAETDEAAFLSKLIKRANMAKSDYEKNGFAYGLSKNFVCWYAAKSAFDLGPKGIRVVSLSPGLVATDMGKMEEEHGGYLIGFACENRMGTPDELGYAIATVADERNGYLAGVDILCDGGSTRGQKEFKKKKK